MKLMIYKDHAHNVFYVRSWEVIVNATAVSIVVTFASNLVVRLKRLHLPTGTVRVPIKHSTSAYVPSISTQSLVQLRVQEIIAIPVSNPISKKSEEISSRGQQQS